MSVQDGLASAPADKRLEQAYQDLAILTSAAPTPPYPLKPHLATSTRAQTTTALKVLQRLLKRASVCCELRQTGLQGPLCVPKLTYAAGSRFRLTAFRPNSEVHRLNHNHANPMAWAEAARASVYSQTNKHDSFTPATNPR